MQRSGDTYPLTHEVLDLAIHIMSVSLYEYSVYEDVNSSRVVLRATTKHRFIMSNEGH